MKVVEGFSGSYAADDVTFLLRVVQQATVSIAEKEALIQSGQRHYSELIGPEHAPSPAYTLAFEEAVARHGDRLAGDVLRLAAHIARTVAGKIVLVSLARAGTPIGVLLVRALRRWFGRDAVHYSISIIAGRGIDVEAVDHIRRVADAPDGSIVFVDGWTGKGVISRALAAAIAGYNQTRGGRVSSDLHVVADLCGHAPAAATTDDYLIPSCLLGATVSGLISRSILNSEAVGPGDFHVCRYYAELAEFDRSRSFVDGISARMALRCASLRDGASFRDQPLPERDRAEEARHAAEAMERWRRAAGVSSVQFVKPGIGEATRVLLRRVPRQLVVRDPTDPGVVPTVLLAEEKRVPVSVDPRLPWAALALIEEQTHGF